MSEHDKVAKATNETRSNDLASNLASELIYQGKTDARDWAKVFMASLRELSHGWPSGIAEDLMVTWFANAIEVGRKAGLDARPRLNNLDDYVEKILNPAVAKVYEGETSHLDVPELNTKGDVIQEVMGRLRSTGGFVNCYLADQLQEILTMNPPLQRSYLHEPLFILRARDRLAPKLVRTWAKRAKNRGAKKSKVREAHEVAKAMKSFKGRRYPT